MGFIEGNISTVAFGFNDAVFGLDEFVEFTAGVRHPGVVDLIITSWGDAIDFSFTAPDFGIDAGAAFWADAFCAFKEPDTHFEAEVGACEGSDGADVDGIEGVIIV